MAHHYDDTNKEAENRSSDEFCILLILHDIKKIKTVSMQKERKKLRKYLFMSTGHGKQLATTSHNERVVP